MAVLEDIRKKGGIIITVVIGLALFAFVLGDFVPGGGRVRNFDVAKVGGQTLSVHAYEAKIEDVTNNIRQRTGQSSIDDQMRDMIHEQAWQMLISETIMQQQYKKVGLIVSPEELLEMITGHNPDPRIRQSFTDPQTGEFNRSALMYFLREERAMNPQAAYEWSLLERFILDDRYMQKYNTLIGRGIFVPDFLAENENQEINRRVDFDFIVQRYASIHDSLVVVSSDDLREHYKRNKNQWEQTASRDIEYVVFPIGPSDEDREAAQAWISNIRPEFEAADDPMQFARLNSRAVVDTRFLTREQLPVQVAELFDEQAGAIAGPYQEGEALKLVRLARAENRPDSVRVRQIVLLPKEQTQASYRQAIALSDSIKTAIEGGADFTRMAVQYSDDPAFGINNGDIGWIQESDIPPGSNMEQLFEGSRGAVVTMETGQAVFVFQVAERGAETRKVQIATLQYNIVPSTRTEQILFAQASKFAIENRSEKQFDEATAAQGLSKRTATHLGENDRQIFGLTSARQIVRWAFEAKAGQVSDVFTIDDAYVVAVLKNVRKKGFAPINQVISEMDFAIRREKKAAMISEQLSEAIRNAQSFSDLAVNVGLPVESATGVTFSAFSIPGAGIEPQLIAATTISDEGNISQPVEGVNGVFVFTVTQVVEPDDIGVEQARERMFMRYFNPQTTENVVQALRKALKVEDMRSKFY